MKNENLKKFVLFFTLLTIFIIYSIFVKYSTFITDIDILIQQNIQSALSFIPVKYPVFADKTGYLTVLFCALFLVCTYFLKKKEWLNILLYLSIPVFGYLLNTAIKNFIQRPRPALDLQISWVHPNTFSYVSTHTLITFCLFGMIICILSKRCSNNLLKYSGITISVLWIFLTGLSRIWIGVHYPSDIFGACILGTIVLIIYMEIYNRIKGSL